MLAWMWIDDPFYFISCLLLHASLRLLYRTASNILYILTPGTTQGNRLQQEQTKKYLSLCKKNLTVCDLLLDLISGQRLAFKTSRHAFFFWMQNMQPEMKRSNSSDICQISSA